jgi:hypothetical protein
MNNHSHRPYWFDDPPLMVARLHQREMEQAAERHRLIALVHASRPRRWPLRTALLRWLRARWTATRRASRPATGPAREMGT